MTQPDTEPYTYTDRDGDQLSIGREDAFAADGQSVPVVVFSTRDSGDGSAATVYVLPADAEHVVTAIRAAAGTQPTAEPVLSPDYQHPECGFHWHGRDGMDIPMRDGQPVCPRCEITRLRAELEQARSGQPDRAAGLRELADEAEESDGHITKQELRRMAALEDRRMADKPQPTTSDPVRRAKFGAAIRPTMLIGLQDADLSGPEGTQRINEWADWIADTAAAVDTEQAGHRLPDTTETSR